METKIVYMKVLARDQEGRARIAEDESALIVAGEKGWEIKAVAPIVYGGESAVVMIFLQKPGINLC